MPKKHTLQLSIPKPCTEDWDNMTPNEQGRHCQSCNKTVVDFSLFTDKQLIEFFEKAAGRVCGRFTNYQVQRQLVYTEPQNHFLHKLLFGTAIAMSFVGSASAANNPNSIPLIEQYGLNNNKEKKLLGGEVKDTLRIKIVDFTVNKPVAHTLIELMHGQKRVAHAYTDTNGIVIFKGIEKYDKGTLYAKCSKDGYASKVIDVEANADGYFMIPIFKYSDMVVTHSVGDTVVITLPEDSIAVRLTDSISGNPIANRQVELYYKGGFHRLQTTDSFGKLELRFDTSTYGPQPVIRVEAEGYLPYEMEVTDKKRESSANGIGAILIPSKK